MSFPLLPHIGALKKIVRLAAFRLIEAGLEQKLSIESKQSPAHLNYAHGAIQLYRISSHSRAAPGKQSRRGTVRYGR